MSAISRYPGVEELIHAVEQGDTELVRRMLATDRFNVNQAISAGYTLMHLAVQRGRLEIVELLASYEAEVNSRGDDGCTPVFMVPLAPASVQVRLYEQLVRLGAARHAVNNQKLSALKYLRLLGADKLVAHLGGRLTSISDDESEQSQPTAPKPTSSDEEAFRARYHAMVRDQIDDWITEHPASAMSPEVRQRIEDHCNREIQHQWAAHRRSLVTHDDDYYDD